MSLIQNFKWTLLLWWNDPEKLCGTVLWYFLHRVLICRIDEVSDAVYYFVVVQVQACFRLQLYPTGLLEADFTDPKCSNDFFNPMGVFSEYDSVNGANDLVSYKKGDKGYSGTFQFEESATATKTEAVLLSFNVVEKIFAVKLIIPSCTVEKP